jgi:protein-tyrosine phosphatase
MNIPFLRRSGPIFGSATRPRFGGLDLHCRLLPFSDDGPFSATDSLKLVQDVYELGFSNLVLTPHVMQGFYDLHPAQIRFATQSLGAEARPNLPGLRLQPAADYYTDKGLLKKLIGNEELLAFTGNDLSRPGQKNPAVGWPDQHNHGMPADTARANVPRPYVLLQTALLAPTADWSEVLRQLRERGYQPVLAQAERYVFLQQTPERAAQLYQTGVRFQLDIASLTGTNGAAALRMAYYLVINRLVSFIGFYPAFGRFMPLLRQAVATESFQQIAAWQ